MLQQLEVELACNWTKSICEARRRIFAFIWPSLGTLSFHPHPHPSGGVAYIMWSCFFSHGQRLYSLVCIWKNPMHRLFTFTFHVWLSLQTAWWSVVTAKKLRTKCGTWRRDIRKEVKPYQFRSGGSWDKPAICRLSFRSHVAWKKRCFEFLELFLVNLIFAFSLAGAMNRPPANDNNHPYPYIYIYVNK